MLAVPSAENATAVTANMSTRRPKRSVKERMEEFPWGRDRQGPKVVNANGDARAVGQWDG